MRILVVEDELASRKFMTHVMGRYGECLFATDGAEAVTMFKQALLDNDPFDLVCMDIMMPRMDGHEALKMLRKVEKANGIKPKDEVKVIMTTALSDPKNVVEAYYQGGATSYLPKPISIESVEGVMSELGFLQINN
ncbi:response regulator [Maridesulfovibrio bastinii]|uniref:response regulator n=1 Tax=Maridesulfovibrio bastinii TaxID=47157 RepID=UPI0003F96C5E|nr:response regulator [Maridesulfovibrio bastinii]